MIRSSTFSALVIALLVSTAFPTWGRAQSTVEHRQFPTYIKAIEAAESGVFMTDGTPKLWYLDDAGARRVNIPVTERIDDMEYDRDGGLLWGCTRGEVFATNPAGAWLSWRVAEPAEMNRIRRCRVIPGPGSVTWVVLEVTVPDSYGSTVVGVDARTSELERHELPGVRFATVAGDGAGGLWAGLQAHRGGSPAVAHFDGTIWRVWATGRMTWAQHFADVYPLDAPTRLYRLWSNARGGAIGLQSNPRAIVTFGSTAPYPQVERAGLACPGGCNFRGYAYDGLVRVLGADKDQKEAKLFSFDETGALVGRSSLPLPDWLDSFRAGDLSAHDGVVWLVMGNVLFRHDGQRWEIHAAQGTVKSSKQSRKDRRKRVAADMAWIALTAGLVTGMPAGYARPFDIPYLRPALTGAAATAAAYPGHWVLQQGVPWNASGLGSALSTFFGTILSAGFATVVTVSVEVWFHEEGEPFPVDGAILGALGGLAVGGLVDVILDSAGVGTTFRRSLLWSGFSASGASLGFNWARYRRE